MMANYGRLAYRYVKVTGLELDHCGQQFVDQNCRCHSDLPRAGPTNSQTSEVALTSEVLGRPYPHYFALPRTINWPTKKNMKNIRVILLSGTRKWGFKQMNIGTDVA